MDPEKQAPPDEIEDEDVVGEMEPKPFRTPDNDLLPPGSKEPNSVRDWRSGMLPSNLAKIRRRSSANRPTTQALSEAYRAPSLETLGQEMKKLEKVDECLEDREQQEPLTMAELPTPEIHFEFRSSESTVYHQI